MTALNQQFVSTRPRRLLRACVTLPALLIVAALTAGPSLGAETPGSDAVQLVFQGKLEESGEPAQRTYDFVFRLFTQSDGGLQVGPSLSVADLAVLDGSFAVNLDFGAARLTGSDVWLEVAVRDGDLAESFTELSPRQRLTGTPYAILAQGGDWSLIGVPVGGPAENGLCPLLAERLASDGHEELTPAIEHSVNFNGGNHTITASTVSGQSYSQQIRIGFSNSSTPNPATFGNIRVGVGTLTPQATLHIAGTTLFSGTAIIDKVQMLRGSVAGGARILGDQGNTPAQPAIGFFSAVGALNDGGGGNGIFRPLANTMAFATGSQERMRLTSGGALGLATQAPTALLDVAGTARVRNLTGGPSNALVSAESNGTLHSIPLTGNANDVLHGNGTFSPVSGSDNDWLGAGSGQMRAGFTSDRVAIGTTASTAKFVVVSNQESPAAFVQFSPPANDPIPIGLLVSVAGTATGNGFGAIIQSSASNASSNNTGLRAKADSPGNINQAIEATASGATFRNTALTAKASGNASRNIGIQAEADGGQALTYGIFAVAQNGAFNRAGFFQGDIEVTGTIHNPSDRRLKREIQDLEGALEILGALRPRSFFYRRDENPGLSLPEGRHLGLIAQELEKVLPGLVTESIHPAAGEEDAAVQAYKSVSYLELIPLLVRGLQEQQVLLAGQEARIRQLEAESATTSSKLAALSGRLATLESALKEPAGER